MSFKMSTQDKGFERVNPKAGLTQCVLTGIIDLGTQEVSYEGQVKKVKQVALEWKLPTQHHIFDEEEGPQPLMLYRDVTASLHPKAVLNSIVTGMLGKSLPEEYELSDLLGANAMVNVVHVEKDGKTYANAASFSPLMDGVDAVEYEIRILELGENFDEDVFNELPEWKQEVIKKAPEFIPF